MTLTRRQLLRQLGATAGASMLPLGVIRGQDTPLMVAGTPVEIAVFAVSQDTVRITVRPVEAGTVEAVPYTGALVADEFGAARQRSRSAAGLKQVRAGNMTVGLTDGPPTITVRRGSATVQILKLDATAPGMTFALPKGPLLGLGEGKRPAGGT